MPDRLAISETADRLAVFEDVGHDIKLWETFDEPAPRLLNRSEIELAESAAEGDQLRIRELLAAKQQHEMIQPCTVDRRECLICQPAQIHAADFGPEPTAGREDPRHAVRR